MALIKVRKTMEVTPFSPLCRLKAAVSSVIKDAPSTKNITISSDFYQFLKTKKTGQQFEDYFEKVKDNVGEFGSLKKMKFFIHLGNGAHVANQNELPIRIVASRNNNPDGIFSLKDFTVKFGDKNNLSGFMHKAFAMAKELGVK